MQRGHSRFISSRDANGKEKNCLSNIRELSFLKFQSWLISACSSTLKEHQMVNFLALCYLRNQMRSLNLIMKQMLSKQLSNLMYHWRDSHNILLWTILKKTLSFQEMRKLFSTLPKDGMQRRMSLEVLSSKSVLTLTSILRFKESSRLCMIMKTKHSM